MIKLDTSIELDDFDPLNENARQIPGPPPSSVHHQPIAFNSPGTSTSRTPANGGFPVDPAKIMSFNNPLYPYYQPPTLRTSAESGSSGSHLGIPTPSPINGDENELLRKYGLDQFSLNDTQSSTDSTTNATTTNSGDFLLLATKSRPNWTTFD